MLKKEIEDSIYPLRNDGLHYYNSNLIEKEINDKSVKKILTLILSHLINIGCSTSFSCLFLFDAIDNCRKLNLLHSQSIDELSKSEIATYTSLMVLSIILTLCWFKSNDRLLKNAINIFFKQNIDLTPKKFWRSRGGKLLENNLSVISSIFMSSVNSLNIYDFIDYFVKNDKWYNKIISTVSTTITGLVSLFCLWSYFKYNPKSQSNKKGSLPLKYCLLAIVMLYCLSYSLLYIDIIKSLGEQTNLFDFNLSFKENNLQQNMIYVASITFVIIPLALILGEIYYNLVIKKLQLSSDNEIFQCFNRYEKFALAKKCYFSLVNSTIIAMSLTVLILSLSTKKDYLLALSLGLFAWVSNVLSSMALSYNNENSNMTEPTIDISNIPINHKRNRKDSFDLHQLDHGPYKLFKPLTSKSNQTDNNIIKVNTESDLLDLTLDNNISL